MGIEVVTVTVGGMTYTAVERLEVTAAYNQAAVTFRFDVAAELGAAATHAIFHVGAEIEIMSNGDLLCRGYVDSREPEFDARNAQISVAGRSLSGDLIDCSAEHKTGRFEKKNPQEIGSELAGPFRANIETDRQLDKIDQYQLTPGESVFRATEKLAREQGKTLTGTAEGNIKITDASQADHQSGAIVEGRNILRGSASHNGANRHSKYSIRGQRPFDHGKDALEIEAVIRDSGVERYRPVIVVEDADTTKSLIKKRAKGRRDRAAGNALKAHIDVQGFHDDGGKLWWPGNLVWTESPYLDIAQDMLIESVQFTQDADRGSIAKLSLTDTRSYGGKGGKGNKSGDVWDQGEGDAEEGSDY